MENIRVLTYSRYSLMLVYTFILIMSTGHLASWYSRTLGQLPQIFAWGLAATLEITAFVLSLTSSYLRNEAPLLVKGSYFVLVLVWIGNFIEMYRAGIANGGILHPAEAFAQSLFIPVSILIGKSVGDILRREEEARKAIPATTEPAPSTTSREPTFRIDNPIAENRYITYPMQAMSSNSVNGEHAHVEQLASTLNRFKVDELAAFAGMEPDEVLEILNELQSLGKVQKTGEYWFYRA